MDERFTRIKNNKPYKTRMLRPPRSGWTLVLFALVLFIIVAAAFEYISGPELILALAVMLSVYFGYQALMKRNPNV